MPCFSLWPSVLSLCWLLSHFCFPCGSTDGENFNPRQFFLDKTCSNVIHCKGKGSNWCALSAASHQHRGLGPGAKDICSVRLLQFLTARVFFLFRKTGQD